jgi:Fe-S-cluster-containing dehydrogenase component/CRP-like cAMP-binding protein
MAEAAPAIHRPQRWDVPFGEEMTEAAVDRLLSIEPFKSIDASKFPSSTPLRGILLNDTRIVRYNSGDLVVREGDYGGSAFLIMEGAVRVTLQSLPGQMLGRTEHKKKGLLASLAQLWTNPRLPEVRKAVRATAGQGVAQRHGGRGDGHIFLQDVPGVLDKFKTIRLKEGEMFGELAALARTPRTATVFADGVTEMLEVRWQGLRDLLRRADALRDHVNKIYRQRSLQIHLKETPLLRHLTPENLKAVADATEFETFGNFDWQTTFKSSAGQSAAQRLSIEPIIAEEGHYPNGLYLIRSGFARLSQKFGNGHRTLAYLGKGQVYGMEELAHNWRSESQIPLQTSVRALGYVDVLRIPTHIVEQYILPSIPQGELPELLKFAAPPPVAAAASASASASAADAKAEETLEAAAGEAVGNIDTGMLEFLVENRFINGTATMIIDVDRCTRCDDCVRACAASHNNNPKFTRHGPIYGHHMVANACMHCADPVCMIGCPTGAIHRDAGTGNVIINDMTCIGCATCANSCPYHNIRMVEARDTRGQFLLDAETNQPILKATKCDLCIDNLGGPACQRACPHDALRRTDMRDLEALTKWLARSR